MHKFLIVSLHMHRFASTDPFFRINRYSYFILFSESRFFNPIPSHQLQASPLLQCRPASPLSQSFQERATSSKSTKVTDGKRRSRVVWATKETQILLEIWGTKYAENHEMNSSDFYDQSVTWSRQVVLGCNMVYFLFCDTFQQQRVRGFKLSFYSE